MQKTVRVSLAMRTEFTYNKDYFPKLFENEPLHQVVKDSVWKHSP